jgi:hypothetical protein
LGLRKWLCGHASGVERNGKVRSHSCVEWGVLGRLWRLDPAGRTGLCDCLRILRTETRQTRHPIAYLQHAEAVSATCGAQQDLACAMRAPRSPLPSPYSVFSPVV